MFLETVSQTQADIYTNMSEICDKWEEIKETTEEEWKNMEFETGWTNFYPEDGMDITLKVNDDEYKGKIYMSPFNIAAITANLIKFVPYERHGEDNSLIDNE